MPVKKKKIEIKFTQNLCMDDNINNEMPFSTNVKK